MPLPFVRHAGCNMVYLRCKQLLGYEIPSTYELNYGLKMKSSMIPGITFNIYVMSYQRPHKIMTKNCLEYCTYVVREEEADAYRNAGIDDMRCHS